MSTSTLTPVDIINLLREITVLSAEEKQRLLDRIASGENTPELKQDLQAAFTREADELERQAAELERLSVQAQQDRQQAENEFAQEAPQIVAAFEEEASQAVSDFTQTANASERELEQLVEGHMQTDEQQEMDAIRDSLLNKSENPLGTEDSPEGGGFEPENVL